MSVADHVISPPPARSAWRQVGTRRAFLAHLAISAIVVGTVCLLIFAVWYPRPYFEVKGAWNVLRVLIGVDLVLGPLLTLILFRPNKPGLGLDVTMIAMIQLAALVYGTSVIYQERPYYAVFAVDRFEVLARGDVDPAAAAAVEFARKPARGPALVYAERPTDVREFQRLLAETVFEGKPDLERRPEYWRAYGRHHAAILARARPLAELAARDADAAARVARASRALDRDPQDLVTLPVIGTDGPLTLVLDPATLQPVDALPIDPWAP